MEENNEAVLAEEVFDGWGDDPVQIEEPAEAEEAEAETVEQEDQPETEEVENASDDESTEELEKELEKASEKADQTFTLKHLDEIKEVTRDEVITLAQKGMDYDRIRAERDSLKTERQQHQDHEEFLQYLADMSGVSVEEVILSTRAKLVQQDEKKKGYDITLEQARYRVESQLKERKKSVQEEPRQEEVPVEEEPAVNVAELREANFKRFVAAYPDVKDLPKEVWAEFGDGTKKELTEIYARYENKQLKEKIKELEQKPRRSTGSRRSNGSPPAEDSIFAGWG